MLYLLHNRSFISQRERTAAHIEGSALHIPSLFSDFYSASALEALRCIVPTGRAVRHVRKECIRAIWQQFRKPTPALQLCTLDAFIRDEYQHIRAQKHPHQPAPRLMSDAFRFALFREALQRCVDDRRLIFYSRDGSAITLAVAQRLADIVYGLKRKGLQAIDLERDIQAHLEGKVDESLFHYARLHDVWQLFKAYEELRGSDIVDMPSLSALLTAELKKAAAEQDVIHDVNAVQSAALSALTIPRTIILDGFSEFTQPELELLRCYADSATAMLFTFNYEPTNSALFGNVIEAREVLERAGFMTWDLPSTAQAQTMYDTERAVLQANLFLLQNEHRVTTMSVQESKISARNQDHSQNTSNPIFHTHAAKLHAHMHILACENKQDEVSSIARFVKHCVQKEGIPLHDIALVLRQPQLYAPLIRETFELNGIPINLSDRASLATAPVIAAIFAMVDVVRGDYRREDLLRALSNPFIALDQQRHRLDMSRIERIAIALRIQGGPRNSGLSGWKRSVDVAIQATSRQLRFLEEAGAEEVERRDKSQNLEEYRLLRSDLDFFADNFPHRDLLCTPTEFHRIFLESFIEKLHIEELLNRDALEVYHLQADELELIRRREQVEQNTRALGTLLALLDELEFILRERKQAPMRFRDYAEMLVASVRAAKVQIREKGNYGLTVTSIEQTRGIPYRVIVLCGMVDLEFPLGYSPEYFLGKELPDSELRHVRAERMSFYHALVNPLKAMCEDRGELLCTYPLHQGKGEECIPSPFLKDLSKLYQTDIAHAKSSELRKQLRALPETNVPVNPSASTQSDVSWYAPWIDAISSRQDAWQALEQEPEIMDFFRAQGEIENIEYVQQIVRDYTRSHGAEQHFHDQLPKAEQQRLQQVLTRAISASDIERFAECPYKYFASKVLALSEEQIESTMLSPLEKGNLLHYIVYRFYTQIAAEQRQEESALLFQSLEDESFSAVAVDLQPRERARYLKVLLSKADEELSRLEFNHPFFQLSEDELLGFSADKAGLLERWLDAELARVDRWQFKPLLFEQGFGMRARDRNSEPIQLGELLLKGKVDRVEIRRCDDGSFEFLVADYKSSNSGVSGNSQIKARKSFQLPLYMSAVEQLLRDHLGVDAKPAGGVYYIFNPADDPFKLVLIERDSSFVKSSDNEGFLTAQSSSSVLKADESRDEILQDLVHTGRNFLEQIANAEFPIRPTDASVCKHCSFSRLCRVRECSVSAPAIDEQADA